MITIRIGVLVLTVYHFPQYCEGVLNLQPSMGAEESICYNNCTHSSPHRCVMVIILFGEWNTGFQVSFPVYYHLPLLGPCLHAATSSHCQNTIHTHGCSTLSAHHCGVSHWSAYLFMKPHCKAYQSIEKYLIWDETLLLTPGKVGMQSCSRSSRRHHIANSCWVYCVSIHTTSSFFKIPIIHPLDMQL